MAHPDDPSVDDYRIPGKNVFVISCIDLHDIRDVYIVAHEDCGAYREFPKDGKFTNREAEISCHKKFATALAEDLPIKCITKRSRVGRNKRISSMCIAS